jgi:hypothetical protein
VSPPGRRARSDEAPAHLLPVRAAGRGTRSSVLLSAVRPRFLGFGLLVLSVVVLAGLWTSRRLRTEVEAQIAGELDAVLDTAVDGLLSFLDDCERLSAAIARSPDVRAAALRAAGAGRSPEIHLAALAVAGPGRVTAPGGAALAAALAPYVEAGHLTGFVLSDANDVVLAVGGGLARVGDRLPASAFPVAEAARRQAPVAGLPTRGPDGIVHVMVAVPLAGISAFLGFGFDHVRFTASLVAARAGKTGETYAIDRQALMLSTSRFPEHLRAAGLLGPDEEDSALRVEIRDPGGDLTTGYRSPTRRRDQPLTLMAAAVTAGRSGRALVPYRDYRGVPVVAAWRWLPDRELGLATEIDAAQAFEPLRALERVFDGILGLLAAAGIAAVVGAAVAERARLRAARSDRAARRAGEYVFERRLGGGGMGEVFLARHALLRRPTAVKLLRPELTGGESIERFEREVRVTATLSHPNTVAIYDYGRTEEGAFYYAMEYLDGIDLDSLVTSFGPLREARVIHLLRQACGALRESHGVGLIHRDIKLANLYLCERGGVRDVLKVLDFGLVKAANEAARLTRASVIVGTPENMAPELFDSAANASAATDIYALGCVAYALLTGRRPFEGTSLAELCNAHLTKPVVAPSQRLGRSLDAALERLVVACLAKRPPERPQSMDEVTTLLDRSPLARAWTSEDADLFWTTHRARFEEIVRSRGEGSQPAPRSGDGDREPA